MADQKITQLTEATSIASSDIFPVVVNPATTPITKKITRANIFGQDLSPASSVGFNALNINSGALIISSSGLITVNYTGGSNTALSFYGNGNVGILLSRTGVTQPGNGAITVTNLGRLNFQCDDYIAFIPSGGSEAFRISGNNFYLGSAGVLKWGTSIGLSDTNLYRYAADTLRTDDDFIANSINCGSPATPTAGRIYARDTIGVFTDGGIAQGTFRSYNNTAAYGSTFNFYRYRGSYASPTYATNGDIIGRLGFYTFRFDGVTNGLIADMRVEATAVPSGSINPAKFVWQLDAVDYMFLSKDSLILNIPLNIGGQALANSSTLLQVKPASGTAICYVKSSAASAGFAVESSVGNWARLHAGSQYSSFFFNYGAKFSIAMADSGVNAYDTSILADTYLQCNPTYNNIQIAKELNFTDPSTPNVNDVPVSWLQNGWLQIGNSGATRHLKVWGNTLVVGAFGCNGQTARTAYASGGAIADTADGTYSANEQTMLGNLKTLVNNIRTALVNNGIMS